MLRKKFDAVVESELYKYSIIALYVFLIILIIILYINYQNLEQSKPIATLNFKESEWIKINTANLLAQFGDRIISPNDPVTLFLNVTNKVPLNIMIGPEFYPYITGELGDVKHVVPMTYGREHTGTFSRHYFPTSEGLNILTVALKISYPNGTFLTYQNATTSFHVVSNTDKLQIQQNNFLFWGITASAIIGGGTLTALYFNQKTSKEEISKLDKQNKLSAKQIKLLKTQNDDLKEQTSIQNRPWISIADRKPSHELSSIMLKIFIKNFGKSPANNITFRGLTDDKPLTIESLSKTANAGFNYSLAPNEGMSFRQVISPEEYKAGHGGNGFYFAMYVEYTYENSKKGNFALSGIIHDASSRGMEYSEKIIDYKFKENNNP